MLCGWVTRRDIAPLWFQPTQWLGFGVGVVFTRHILVRSLGTAGPIRMVWEQVSPTARIPDGASASVTDMATILGTTHGGAQRRITDAVGIHITDGRSEEHTSEPSHGYISYAVFCLEKKKIM